MNKTLTIDNYFVNDKNLEEIKFLKKLISNKIDSPKNIPTLINQILLKEKIIKIYQNKIILTDTTEQIKKIIKEKEKIQLKLKNNEIPSKYIEYLVYRKKIKIKPDNPSHQKNELTIIPKSLLEKYIEKISKIFKEMGFIKKTTPYISSEYKNMDKMFVPVYHPARTAHDSFFLKKLNKSIPKNLNFIKKTHLGKNYSGWGVYDYSPKKILRTHTTPDLLEIHSQEQVKKSWLFSIQKIFRNEKKNKTHLSEFHQVEVSISDPELTLLGFIQIIVDILKKLGQQKIRIQPTFFPYTEPSFEVYIQHPTTKEEIEIAGGGLFRDEIKKIFKIKQPIFGLAFGLERVIMILENEKEIRNIKK